MRHVLRAVLVIVSLSAIACDSPTSANRARSVAGTWDAEFDGIIQGSGHAQDDTIVMELTQSGSSVSGALRVTGTIGVFPLTGTVDGDAFNYTATGTIPETACSVLVTGALALNAAGTRLSGPQTHTTCQGVAIGTLTATRR
jgi:hypothetical protein